MKTIIASTVGICSSYIVENLSDIIKLFLEALMNNETNRIKIY